MQFLNALSHVFCIAAESKQDLPEIGRCIKILVVLTHNSPPFLFLNITLEQSFVVVMFFLYLKCTNVLCFSLFPISISCSLLHCLCFVVFVVL